MLLSLVLEEETGKDESVNTLKEKKFELENSIVKLNIDHEKVIGEKEKPRYGSCSFDHSVIPFCEMQLCYHKQE